jgi:hypothetical protein
MAVLGFGLGGGPARSTSRFLTRPVGQSASEPLAEHVTLSGVDLRRQREWGEKREVEVEAEGPAPEFVESPEMLAVSREELWGVVAAARDFESESRGSWDSDFYQFASDRLVEVLSGLPAGLRLRSWRRGPGQTWSPPKGLGFSWEGMLDRRRVWRELAALGRLRPSPGARAAALALKWVLGKVAVTPAERLEGKRVSGSQRSGRPKAAPKCFADYEPGAMFEESRRLECGGPFSRRPGNGNGGLRFRGGARAEK